MHENSIDSARHWQSSWKHVGIFVWFFLLSTQTVSGWRQTARTTFGEAPSQDIKVFIDTSLLFVSKVGELKSLKIFIR